MTAPFLNAITVMKSLLIAIAIVATPLLSGCAPVLIVGAGVGAGAFSYVAGNLIRVYEADYQQSIKAGVNVMEQLSFKRKEESDNELKTIIEGYLYFDTPVTIEVVYVDDGWTQIGVRTGYVGVDNLEKSEQVHTDIAEELKRLKQRSMRTASQNKKVDKPLNLQATSQKKEFKPTESKSKTSYSLYETFTPPPPTAAPTSAGITEESQSIDKLQGESVPSRVNALEDESDAPSVLQETVLAPTGSGIDGTQEMTGAEDKTKQFSDTTSELQSDLPPTLAESVLAPTESGIDATQTFKEEFEARSPSPETYSATTASLTDDTQISKKEQDKLFLLPKESRTKAFIYYPKSSIAIPPGSYVVLDDIVSQLNNNPSAKVDIRGYTDSSGSTFKNLAVSSERVLRIRIYLIENGISDERITAQGLGATNFLESNRTDRLKTMNHRVEIAIK